MIGKDLDEDYVNSIFMSTNDQVRVLVVMVLVVVVEVLGIGNGGYLELLRWWY